MHISKNTVRGETREVRPENIGFSRLSSLVFGLFLLGFLLYANTITHDYVLDDPIITTGNRFVQEGFSGIDDIFSHGYLYGFNGKNDQSYRPLVLVNMAIEKQIFGNNPTVHHFFNVLIYALSGVLLFLFLKQIFRKESIWLSLGITVLFIAHPIHTEVVANIKGRDELLSFSFMMLSLYTLMRQVKTKQPIWLLLSLIFYFLCILSKETGLAMFGLVPFTLYFFTENKIQTILSRSALFLIPVVIYFLLRMMAMDNMTFGSDMLLINNSLMGAASVSERLATAISILGRYVGLLVFPHPLSYDYSYNQVPLVGWGSWRTLAALALYAGMAMVAFLGLKRKSPVSYGIIWFVVMLLLVANLHPKLMVGATMAERFVFSSTLGFCMVVGWLLYRYLKVGETFASAKLFFVIIGLLTTFYSIKTITRNTVWKDAETLYLSGLKTAPNSARAHNHYGSHLLKKAEVTRDPNLRNQYFTQAIPNFDNALKILPEYGEAEYNKGVCFMALGNIEAARQTYQRILTYSPNYVDALNNLGVIYFNEKNYDKALEYWLRILDRQPRNISALGNVGAIYQNAGDAKKALFYYEKAIEIGPNRNVLNNAIKAYRSTGQEQKARSVERRLNGLN